MGETTQRVSQEKPIPISGQLGSGSTQDPLRMICGRGCILWMMLLISSLVPFFHHFPTALCKKDSKLLVILDTIGLTPKPLHRCQIPLADDPDAVIIPKKEKTTDIIPKSLSYILVDESANPHQRFLEEIKAGQIWRGASS